MKIDLSVNYLGLALRSPCVPSASPASERVSNIQQMADAGASAVVFHSLFAEQDDWGPDAPHLKISPRDYYRHLAEAKRKVDIPLIASLNATPTCDWNDEAREIEAAGADAIELSIYHGPSLSEFSSAEIEAQTVETVERLRQQVNIPIAVKLTPYYTNLYRLAQDLVSAGADGLVFFTRFAQPDLGFHAGRQFLSFPLTTPMDLQLPLHWIATLARRIPVSFAATGGIQRPADVVKTLMAGAHVAMLCSVLLRRGFTYIGQLESDLETWMTDMGYRSIAEFQGCLSFSLDAHPEDIERKNSIRMLTRSEHALNALRGTL